MVAVTGSRIATPSITNTQEADVDEGGIVKVRGDTLVILRRGRLFTVSLAGGGMRPVDSINAFPPGVSGRGDWYDEMLLSGDRVIVVGYSYARGGTEINRFRLDAAGRLRFEDAYHLRSNDYYSSRNYASRLIGNRLIFYTPLYLGWNERPARGAARHPQMGAGRRRATAASAGSRGRARSSSRRRCATIGDDDPGAAFGDQLRPRRGRCSIARRPACSARPRAPSTSRRARSICGSAISGRAAAAAAESDSAFLYRLPFGRERPSAIGAAAHPVDQFSFREDRSDGVLNVLLRKRGRRRRDGRARSHRRRRRFAAPAACPTSATARGRRRRRAIARCPACRGQSWSFQNRFVGNHVLYGGGVFGEGGKARARRGAGARRRGRRARRSTMPSAGSRRSAATRSSSAAGRGAISASPRSSCPGAGRRGSATSIPFPPPRRARPAATPSSSGRSTPDGASGILGLPIARPVEPAYRRFFGSAASMLFLRRDARRFAPAGELDGAGARRRSTTIARRPASTGTAMPARSSSGDRIFALLGYELVEGRMARGAIREIGRTNFSPGGRRGKGG